MISSFFTKVKKEDPASRKSANKDPVAGKLVNESASRKSANKYSVAGKLVKKEPSVGREKKPAGRKTKSETFPTGKTLVKKVRSIEITQTET